MNKKIISAIALVSMLALVGCNEEKQPQKPAPQFGVVQLSKLYQDSQIGKAGVERLKQIEEKAMVMLKGIQADAEKARAAGNEEEVTRLESDLQARVYFLQEVIKQDQEHVMNVFQTAMKNTFDKYSKEHVLSASPEADVTAAVQALLDQEKISFGALPSLELPKLPEPPNAAPREEAPAVTEAPVEKEAPAAEAPAAPATEAPAAK